MTGEQAGVEAILESAECQFVKESFKNGKYINVFFCFFFKGGYTFSNSLSFN